MISRHLLDSWAFFSEISCSHKKIYAVVGNLHTSLRTCRAIGAVGHLGEHRYHRLDPGDDGTRKDAETSLVVNVGWIIYLLGCNILFSGMHGY